MFSRKLGRRERVGRPAGLPRKRRAQQDQPAGPVGVPKRELDHRWPAGGVADGGRPLDAERIQQQGVGVGLVGRHNPRRQGGPEVAEPGGGDHPEAITDPALGTPQAHVEAADQRVAEQQRRALAVLGVVTVVEVVAGFATRSLALLSDAGHMLTDVWGLGMALAAIHVADRASARRGRRNSTAATAPAPRAAAATR
jgi:hypothetical protein